MSEILHLRIKRFWFDKIAKGEKPREYRVVKQYYTSRLIDKDGKKRYYSEIHLYAGYQKDCPMIRVRWNGWRLEMYDGKLCYAFNVTEILEIKNWSE